MTFITPHFLYPQETVEIIVNLSLEYSFADANIYCRCSALDRTEQLSLNQDLKSYEQSLDKREPLVYLLISWVQDKAEAYFCNSKASKTDSGKDSKEIEELSKFVRFWIKSHHIYSKFKQREIIDLEKVSILRDFAWQVNLE